MKRRTLLATLGGALAAGCTAQPTSQNTATTTTTKTTQQQATTESAEYITGIEWARIERRPGFAVHYRLEDYATILLHGPDDSILADERLNPSATTVELPVKTPRGGSYRVVLRQNDETITERSLTYEGPQLEIEDVQPNWSGHELAAVDITVRNQGDLDARITTVAYAFNGSQKPTSGNLYVAPNETATVSSGELYGLSASEPGTRTGSVTVTTTENEVSQQFSHRFDGPNLELQNIDDTWHNSTLSRVTLDIANNGDLPADIELTVHHDGEVVLGPDSASVDPNEVTPVEVGGLSTYETDSPGQKDIIVRATAEHDTAKKTVSHIVE